MHPSIKRTSMVSRNGALTLTRWHCFQAWREAVEDSTPVPQEARVLNVVSLPKHRASASTEPSAMAEEALVCHGSETLKMSFLQWSYWSEWPSFRSGGGSWPLVSSAVSCRSGCQVEERMWCRRHDLSLCFHSCQKPIEQEVRWRCQGRYLSSSLARDWLPSWQLLRSSP